MQTIFAAIVVGLCFKTDLKGGNFFEGGGGGGGGSPVSLPPVSGQSTSHCMQKNVAALPWYMGGCGSVEYIYRFHCCA